MALLALSNKQTIFLFSHKLMTIDSIMNDAPKVIYVNCEILFQIHLQQINNKINHLKQPYKAFCHKDGNLPETIQH